MTKRIFFLQRVNDHLQYLNNITKTLDNDHCFDGQQHNIDCFKGTDDTECNLGRWLYGEGSVEINALDNSQIRALFYGLFEPHTRFHAMSKTAIEKRQAGDKEGAQDAITEMRKISNLLTSTMLELEAILQKEGLI